MYEIALVLSIISSVLVIIYLLGLIFGKRKDEKDLTITISGRIVTTTVNHSGSEPPSGYQSSASQDNGHRVVDGELVDAKKLQSQIENILKNVKN
jgi:hypothetical protein